MTVVAHHPVAIHAKRVLRRQFAVNANLPIGQFFEGVVLVGGDPAPVQVQVARRQFNRRSFFGKHHRAKIVRVPLVEFFIPHIGEHFQTASAVRVAHGLHRRRQRVHGIHFTLGQGHHGGNAFGNGADGAEVEFGQSELAEGVLGFGLVGEHHAVFHLQALGILHRFAVDVQLSFHHTHRLAWQTDTALDVVLHLVDRTGAKAWAFGGLGTRLFEVALGIQGKRLNVATRASDSVSAQQRVVIVPDEVGVYIHGVSVREAEHHGIVTLHVTEPGQAKVGKGEPTRVARRQAAWQGVVHERHGERRPRQFGAVRHLGDNQVIAHEHAALHGRGGNREGLDDEHAQGPGHDGRPNEGFAPLARGGFACFGPIPLADPVVVALAQLPKSPPRQSAHDPLFLHASSAKGQPEFHVHHGQEQQVDARHKEKEDPVPWPLDQFQPRQKVQSRDGAFPGSSLRVFATQKDRQRDKLKCRDEEEEEIEKAYGGGSEREAYLPFKINPTGMQVFVFARSLHVHMYTRHIPWPRLLTHSTPFSPLSNK